MRETKGVPLWPLVLVGVVGLGALVFFGGPGTRWLNRWLPTEPRAGAELGRLVDVSGGAVTRIGGPDLEKFTPPLDHPVSLADGDRLETDGAARATLLLGSHDELILSPRTVVSLELWNARDANSPVYVHVLAGDVASKRSGVRGRAYVVRGGRLYLPGQRPGEKAPPLVVTRGAQAPQLSVGVPAPKDDVADAKPVDEDAPPTKEDPTTLANEYVEDVIASRHAQFQKCWLSRLKDKPGLKGALTVQFEITRRGKVHEVKVTDSSLGDDQLGACVATVVERLPFRSFTGPEISISYPITFE